MKMKRFTLVLGVLFMGGILATSMTSCGNESEKETKEAVVPADNDEVDATDADAEEAVDEAVEVEKKCGEGKCGEGKCGGAEATTEKAVDKDEVIKGQVEASASEKEKELSKNAPVEKEVKTIEGDKKVSADKESKELKCGGK